MIKSYKVRLEPNNKQARKFKQFAGAARYAYNWALAKENEAYTLGSGFINDNELRKLFTKHKANFPKFKSRKRSRLALLKLNHKLTNIRNDYIHKVTTDIVKREPSFIVIEDLNVSGMMKNKHLAKSVQEQNFYRFREVLTYKAENAGIKLIIADRFYPSSKLCSNCGAIKQSLKLTERVFVCNECGLEIDRDYNASLNLYHLGSSTVSSTGINVCGVLNKTVVALAKQNTMKQKSNRILKAS